MKKSRENNLAQVKFFLQTSPYIRWLMLTIITVLFTATHHPEQSNVSYVYSLGDVSKRDIKAPKDFFIEDKDATNLKKNEVMTAVKKIYDLDAKLVQKIFSDIDSAMAIPRQLFAGDDDLEKQPPTLAMVMDTKPAFEEKLGIQVSNGAYTILFKYQFSNDISDKIKTIMPHRCNSFYNFPRFID